MYVDYITKLNVQSISEKFIRKLKEKVPLGHKIINKLQSSLEKVDIGNIIINENTTFFNIPLFHHEPSKINVEEVMKLIPIKNESGKEIPKEYQDNLRISYGAYCKIYDDLINRYQKKKLSEKEIEQAIKMEFENFDIVDNWKECYKRVPELIAK